MDLRNLSSIPHLHAAARRDAYLAEAERDRRVASLRSIAPARAGTTAGVRSQLGAVLIRAGERVRGETPRLAEAA